MSSNIVKTVIVIAIAASMVLFFGLPSAGPDTSDVVAEVDGKRISRRLFEEFRSQTARQLDLPSSLDARTRDSLIERQTMDQVISRYVQLAEAERLGLGVSDRELAAALQRDPGLQGENGYDRDLLRMRANRLGLSVREYQDALRDDLALGKLRRFVQAQVRVSDAAVREQVLRAGTQVSLKWAKAAASAQAESAAPTDEQVATLLRESPERAQAAYQRRIGEFVQKERIRARHILLSGEDAEARALTTRARILEGEDFSAVARELSEDTATKSTGGMLGLIPRGRMLAEFEDAAFALPTGEVSGPVKTERGVHLILVDEKLEGFERSFDEVKDEVARDLLAEEAAQAGAVAAAQRVLDRARGGEDFEAAAAAEGLQTGTTPPFQAGPGGIPGLPLLGAKQAALALRPEAPLAPRVFNAGRDAYVIGLLERSEPDAEELQSEIETAREQLVNAVRIETLITWVQERREALEAEGRIVRYLGAVEEPS